MRCSRCGCPGAVLLFNVVMCWNEGPPKCFNYDPKVAANSNWTREGKCVNGDSVKDVQEFLEKRRPKKPIQPKGLGNPRIA